MKAIVNELVTSDVVLAVLTDYNPNVWYELGARHSLRHGIIMMLESGQDIPFDLKHYGVIYYDDKAAGVPTFQENLRGFIQKIESVSIWCKASRINHHTTKWTTTMTSVSEGTFLVVISTLVALSVGCTCDYSVTNQHHRVVIAPLSLPWRISLYYMTPEWVGDVMYSAIGWLLDVTVERNTATLWIKTTHGGILRLADRYRPCFYILSRNERVGDELFQFTLLCRQL